MPDPIEIEFLADRPECVPVLADWFRAEWSPYYGPEGPGDAERDLRECCSRSTLPVAFVALLDDRPCGTAALKSESVSTYAQRSPWLAALLVPAAFTGRGIEQALIDAVESFASRCGFRELHVGTAPLEAPDGPGGDPRMFLRRGWDLVETVPYFVGDATILRKRLSAGETDSLDRDRNA